MKKKRFDFYYLMMQLKRKRSFRYLSRRNFFVNLFIKDDFNCYYFEPCFVVSKPNHVTKIS